MAPTDQLPIVRFDARVGERSVDLARWGLVPFWAKDIKVGFANINAKAEGIENRPAFREAFQRRRCLVRVDNFYEWKKTATGKHPYAIALADRGLMALAGLWENWRSPDGEWVRSFAIITTTPNELCAELHNRMPVVLGPETWPEWLGEAPAEARQLKTMLAPYPAEQMTCWPVSRRVGNVKNNDPTLIERYQRNEPARTTGRAFRHFLRSRDTARWRPRLVKRRIPARRRTATGNVHATRGSVVASSAYSRSPTLWELRPFRCRLALSLTGGKPTVLGCLSGGGCAPKNEPARAAGEHASRSAHFRQRDVR